MLFSTVKVSKLVWCFGGFSLGFFSLGRCCSLSNLKLACFGNKWRRNFNVSVEIFKTFYGSLRTCSRKSKESVDCVELYSTLLHLTTKPSYQLGVFWIGLITFALSLLTRGTNISKCLSEKRFQMHSQQNCSRCPWDTCCRGTYLVISRLGQLKVMT